MFYCKIIGSSMSIFYKMSYITTLTHLTESFVDDEHFLTKLVSVVYNISGVEAV